MSTIDCQACVIRLGWSSKLIPNNDDIFLNPVMENLELYLEPFATRMQLNLAFQKDFASLPPISAEINVCSQRRVRNADLIAVRKDLADLPGMHIMDFDKRNTHLSLKIFPSNHHIYSGWMIYAY